MNRFISKGLRTSLSSRFLRRIFAVQLLLTALAILSTAFLARHYLKNSIVNQAEDQLRSSLQLIRSSVQNQRQNPLELCSSISVDPTTNYTLLSLKGEVICETIKNPSKLGVKIQTKDVEKVKQERLTTTWNSEEKTLFGSIIIEDPRHIQDVLLS